MVMDIKRRQHRQTVPNRSTISHSSNMAVNNFHKNSFIQIEQEKKTTEPAKYLEKKDHIKKHKPTRKRGKIIRNIVLFFCFILFLFISISVVSFFYKTYSIGKKISVSSQEKSFSENIRNTVSTILTSDEDKLTLNGYQEGRINILLLGAAGEKKPGKNLTDTIMIMSIDTVQKKVALLSLPRDLYVQIGDSKAYTKLNSVYQIGLNENKNAEYIKKSIQKITNLDIHYYLIVNFDAFVEIIDSIGGIKVNVERDIYDTRYPGPNYSYETFKLDKGLHDFDGETALKYVRERHDDPQGDFGRAKRQQQVIQAVKNKIFSAQTLFNPLAINKILDSVGDNIKTDLTMNEMEQCLKISRMVDMQNITNTVVDAWKPESLLKVSHVELGGVNAFILVPRVGNYSEIQELAQNIFSLDTLNKRRENILQEKASIVIINRSGSNSLSNSIRSLLVERLDIKNVIIETDKEPSQEEFSFIQDNTYGRKLFTLDELTKKLPAKLSPDNSINTKNDYDFIVVLGEDLADTYKYEEDSIEEFNKAQEE